MVYKKVYKKSDKRKDMRKAYGEYPAKKGYNKIVYGKRYNKNPFRSSQLYGRRPWPWPSRLTLQMAYTKTGTLTSDATFPDTFGSEQVFRLNSIYDPQFATGGDTVIGHPELGSMYAKYIVYAVKVEIVFRDPDGDGTITGVSILNRDNSTTTGVLQGFSVPTIERRELNYTSALNNSGKQTKRITLFVRPWTLIGLSKLEWLANKTEHASNWSDNPTADLYLRLAVANSRGVSKTVLYNLKLIYYVECFSKLTPTVAS